MDANAPVAAILPFRTYMSTGWISDAEALILLALVLARAVWTDLRDRRIENVVVLCGMAGGMVIRAGVGGPGGAAGSATGLVAGFAVFLVPCLLGRMGAGDVKLMAAIGALQGARFALAAASFACVVAGCLAIGIVLARLPARRVLAPAGARAGNNLPFAPAIAAGTILALIPVIPPLVPV